MVGRRLYLASSSGPKEPGRRLCNLLEFGCFSAIRETPIFKCLELRGFLAFARNHISRAAGHRRRRAARRPEPASLPARHAPARPALRHPRQPRGPRGGAARLGDDAPGSRSSCSATPSTTAPTRGRAWSWWTASPTSSSPATTRRKRPSRSPTAWKATPARCCSGRWRNSTAAGLGRSCAGRSSRRATRASRGKLEDLFFVHGSGTKPADQYVWPGHPQHHLQLNRQLDEWLTTLRKGFRTRHAFCGHTHVPAVLTAYDDRDLFPIESDWNRKLTFVGPRTIFYVPAGNVRLEGLSGRRVVVNPGSVGQPRDEDPLASWALYDGDSIEFRRVPYDTRRTGSRIRGLPLSEETREFFADRLEEGV
ncbi:MAG: metallophosphoesterase family protein [Myxococcales bacterium]